MERYKENIDFALLKEAVISTAKRRESEEMLLVGKNTLEEAFLDTKMGSA
jgi:hypothetical protein